MKNLIRGTWLWLRDLLKSSPPPHLSLREKAMEIAGRVPTKNENISCPECKTVFNGESNSSLRMTLALHMSLWHPDEVLMRWSFMKGNYKQVSFHLPSFIFGVGISCGVAILLAISAGNRSRYTPYKITR
ncbi:uncharacterized protein LOC127240841 [Andrographis paniculata]|uniref:uncharacterized protein LOC127240841 n=1 Tax=Andrographis paniculata TaxID=175694 RepID=UPI0021E75961|nr:uncharacterized protein LOC127240841 [Andrographis paniculata]